MRFVLAALVALCGCSEPKRDRAAPPVSTASEPAPSAPAEKAKPPGLGACGDSNSSETLAPGLELLTIRPKRTAAVDTADRCLRALRADPAHFRVALGASARTGETHNAERWAKLRSAVAVTNASMFHAGGASTGLLVDGEVLTATINKKFGAFMAANPRAAGKSLVTMWGRGCPNGSIEALRRDYRTVVQNYRLLDCNGAAIRWADEKVYSAAAVGIDRSGRVLFIHLRAPYKMSEFTEMLADPATGLDLAAAMYVEGGPEATLYIKSGDRQALFVGSFETDFLESDDNKVAWPLPNVLMLVPTT